MPVAEPYKPTPEDEVKLADALANVKTAKAEIKRMKAANIEVNPAVENQLATVEKQLLDFRNVYAPHVMASQ